MKLITVKVTAAHIATTPARGYGPRLIIIALKARLIDHVFVAVDNCWVTLAHQGVRYYLHLPLRIIPYTFRMQRVPLLVPITFRMELPAALVRPRSKTARKLDP